MSGSGGAIAQSTLLSQSTLLTQSTSIAQTNDSSPSPSPSELDNNGDRHLPLSSDEPLPPTAPPPPTAEPSPENDAGANDTVFDNISGAFTPALSPQYPPPELDWLRPGTVPPAHIITSSTISLSGLTPPSLWWTDQQFGGKTLKGWIAYPGTETLPPRVDLVVNRQLWGLSDYLERYSFVHHFGRAAQSFGYTIRVFNDIGEPLAIYPCPITPCAVILNSSGIGVLRDNSPF